MPFHQLAVAPADVSGARLGLALNVPAPQPLASYRLHHPDGGTLLLGVLGASHLITVHRGSERFSEEVSCTARTHGGSLPAQSEAPGYRLQTGTDTHDEPAFRRLAHDLRRRCTHNDGWLGGAFPGDDAALTVLTARPEGSGWYWRTWHLYPLNPSGSGGTVVHTSSRWCP
ncbi:hypothetical protein MB901379_01944 [Mycobacterium basiliense]|uniref:DUF2617 domain-containing protein n=1 Tax=Mycobacterium basiliense TaxID=2094119 RepID=A0A3S4FM78_9MYCO|nr:DUF2617 family protein [Mycobacterium basiliense]VDM88382.1 hypothetical protein MB901379_01944 [Mycobacterium basiliense]